MAVELQFWKQAVALPPRPWPSDLAAAARSEESEEEQAQKEDKPWTGGHRLCLDMLQLHMLQSTNVALRTGTARSLSCSFLTIVGRNLRSNFVPTARPLQRCDRDNRDGDNVIPDANEASWKQYLHFAINDDEAKVWLRMA
ncbi:unnamed protein product [Cladocopium goreaui]|uniref:Uncharacterized protein n=1 Tax=Cladocopium goreaui TaxID=2562237 RepID=A0A9P1BH47_9DINO|nr:unnamed protein product [Cladocopium goreaui]